LLALEGGREGASVLLVATQHCEREREGTKNDNGGGKREEGGKGVQTVEGKGDVWQCSDD